VRIAFTLPERLLYLINKRVTLSDKQARLPYLEYRRPFAVSDKATHMHVCMCVCEYVCVRRVAVSDKATRMHVCMRVCMYVCMYVGDASQYLIKRRLCMYVCVYVCMYVGDASLDLTKQRRHVASDFIF